jgi:hypothetical protein
VEEEEMEMVSSEEKEEYEEVVVARKNVRYSGCGKPPTPTIV